MELAMRKDVPVEETWDLSLIYPTEEAFQADVERARQLADDLCEKFQGKLTGADAIVRCMDEYEEYLKAMVLTGDYAGLAVEVDYTDGAAMERSRRIQSLYAELDSRLTFIRSEILQQPEAVIEEAAEKSVKAKNYLRDILREKPYVLSPETERVLAAFSQTFETPYEVYNIAKLADMKFPSFTVNGKEYPLGYSLFEDDYEYERDTDVRRAAFAAFSDKIRQYENVTAAAYNACVTTEKVESRLRGHASVFDYLLFDQKVTREMYDRQIDLITEKLAPHMRRYAKLIQRIYKLDKMTFADLKLPLDPDYDPKVTIAQSHDLVKEGLSVLGEDYGAMIDEAYRDRWIDFAKNQGKCTGGFCSSPYGRGSFILLSWNDRMSDVSTVAHELGHAGHFRLANSHQSLYDTDVSTYFVEAPSTMNEILLAHHLLKTNDDPRFKRWVLGSMIGNTYYHNFVTHLREAWYQREVYKIIDEGGSVDAETLSDIFRRNLELFWGDTVELTEGAELTWMRQPHYYMGLYSYTYSAGLTVATQAALRIEREGAPAVADWMEVLKAGSTLDPAGLAKLAGIDISTDKPLLDTIDYIGSVIAELERLTDEIEGK
ncbi:MAG: oligoendopeptidase F [Lachnospiraceae bacterium]|nr:oligoendopeptidase F [Lachnospiraceae bacterium]